MTKPNKIYTDGFDFFFWDYEPQTKMKHQVLNAYLKPWAQKLGKYYTPVFFDCHAGCGAYIENGNIYWGSPIIAAKLADQLETEYRKKIQLFAIDNDEKNINNLKSVIKHVKIKNVPELFIGNYEKILTNKKVIDLYANTPAFFFIDPFGFSLNYNILTQIMNYHSHEIFVNFMFNNINRFLSLEFNDTFNKLFGCTEWNKALSISGDNREIFLVDLFKRQLKKIAKFVFPYKLQFYDKSRTYYYLFHATNNLDGCSIMKSCFAGCNYGKVEYLGCRRGRLSLFDINSFVLSEMKEYLINKYSGQKVEFRTILEQCIDETLYLESNIRTALKELRTTREIRTYAIDSKKDGLKGRDLIEFIRS